MTLVPKDDEPAPKSKSNGDSKSSKSKANGASPKKSDVKGVQAGSKVLRAKTRQQFMDPEASTTLVARIAEHQKELHLQRQDEGIARFAGEDDRTGREDGKIFKRFQSYKGEAALPKEVESLRVRSNVTCFGWTGL